ncbi:hypothetical protein LTR85_011024 [Meristemomyces frigidus]|nr:hypothetical protein LTR85_011024 [Meristemomyces frigidus]
MGNKRLTNPSDWVHDRFQDNDRRFDRRAGPDVDRTNGAKLRVDNVHYDLTEDDLRGLFERKGPLASVKLLYDRMDRSQGTAFVTYEDPRDARDAIADYDGQNANGMPIKITMLPTAPAAASGPRVAAPGASLFDRLDARPPRSMFDRIDGARGDGREDADRGERRRRDRSDSPRKARGAVPEHIDRYVPGGRDSRSPVRRRGTPRESGRRPGARREESGRGGGGGGGRRGGRTDEEGRPLVGGRPKKTAAELDAEMEDYWGSKPAGEEAPAKSNGAGAAQASNGGVHATTEEDTDMVL